MLETEAVAIFYYLASCRCAEVLRQPRQTPCGHRVCGPCVHQLESSHGSTAFRCPADEDGCLEMTVDEVRHLQFFSEYPAMGPVLQTGPG